MLGLEYLVCSDCDAVYAVPHDDDAECWRCGADRLAPVSADADTAAAAYFAPDPDG